jgi:hypothetical protein
MHAGLAGVITAVNSGGAPRQARSAWLFPAHVAAKHAGEIEGVWLE